MKKLLLPLAFASIAATSWAVTPLWLRDVKISPDGRSIAFTYKGDIYKVAANGGTAQRLTTQPTYESNPVWSPDGKSIAFASDRNGDMDVYQRDSRIIHPRRQERALLGRDTGCRIKRTVPIVTPHRGLQRTRDGRPHNTASQHTRIADKLLARRQLLPLQRPEGI